jgi:UrcA family protein
VLHVAHIDVVDDLGTSKLRILKEIKMDKSFVTVARALTICVAATLGVRAADAATPGPIDHPSAVDAPLQYVVRLADLNLSSDAGVTALYSRLRRAARWVCIPPEHADLGRRAEYQACTEKAITDAVANVNSPLLTQHHLLQSKGNRVGFARRDPPVDAPHPRVR